MCKPLCITASTRVGYGAGEAGFHFVAPLASTGVQQQQKSQQWATAPTAPRRSKLVPLQVNETHTYDRMCFLDDVL